MHNLYIAVITLGKFVVKYFMPLLQEDDLELLKKSSRLIHCVSAPFIVSPIWRREALSKHDLLKHHDSLPEFKQAS